MAAIGLEQLKRFPALVNKRKALAALYEEYFAEVSSVKYFHHDYSQVAPHIYVVQLLKQVDRRKIIERLGVKGIQAGVHYKPNHWLKFYHQAGHAALPVTEKIYPNLLTLPLHPDLNEVDILRVAEALVE